jgi:hypothetical protein
LILQIGFVFVCLDKPVKVLQIGLEVTVESEDISRIIAKATSSACIAGGDAEKPIGQGQLSGGRVTFGPDMDLNGPLASSCQLSCGWLVSYRSRNFQPCSHIRQINVFNCRAANSGCKPKAERIAPAEDETVERDKLASVFDVEHCANNFKPFASLQTLPTFLAAIAPRVYPSGY